MLSTMTLFRTRRSCSSGTVDSCVIGQVRNEKFSSNSLDDGSDHADCTSDAGGGTPRVPPRKKSSVGCNEMRSGDAVKEYRIVLMGAGKVGKSALVRRFLEHNYSDHYTPTIEDSYRHILQSPDGTCYVIEILDTSGMYEFPAMRELNIRQAGAFILVFGLNSPDSMDQVKALHEQILSIRGEDNTVPIVLVGNKNDLTGSDRRVPPESAASMSRDLGHRYMETSAECDHNIEQLFSLVIFRYLHVDARAKSLPQASERRPRHKMIQKRHSEDGQMRLRVRPDGSMRQVFHSIDHNLTNQVWKDGVVINSHRKNSAHVNITRRVSLAIFRQRSQSTSTSESSGQKSIAEDPDINQMGPSNTRDGRTICRNGEKCCFL